MTYMVVHILDLLRQCGVVCFLLIIFVLPLFILEGPPQFGMTPDSVTIGDHTSVNDKVMDIQITDFGDFIQNIEPDYDNGCLLHFCLQFIANIVFSFVY
jgi:hypothetical protein